MDTYINKTMVSIVSLGKLEIIRSEVFMLSKARLKFLKKMIILGPKTAILGPQFCRTLVLGPHFWWSGGPGGPGPPGSTPGSVILSIALFSFPQNFRRLIERKGERGAGSANALLL